MVWVVNTVMMKTQTKRLQKLAGITNVRKPEKTFWRNQTPK